MGSFQKKFNKNSAKAIGVINIIFFIFGCTACSSGSAGVEKIVSTKAEFNKTTSTYYCKNPCSGVDGLTEAQRLYSNLAGYKCYACSDASLELVQSLNLGDTYYLLLITGIATVITSLGGIVGFWFQIKKAMSFYMILMLLIAVSQIALGVYWNGRSGNELIAPWSVTSDQAQDGRLEMMEYYQCCGLNVTTEYVLEPDCSVITDLQENPGTKTCLAATTDFINGTIHGYGSYALTIGIFELLMTGAVCWLIFKSGDKEEYMDSIW